MDLRKSYSYSLNHFQFVRWEGDGINDDNKYNDLISVTMTNDKNIRAVFAQFFTLNLQTSLNYLELLKQPITSNFLSEPKLNYLSSPIQVIHLPIGQEMLNIVML